MLAKAFLLCITVVMALSAPRLYSYYKHKWGYDDSTVIHQSPSGSSYSIPHELPTMPQ